MNGQRSRTWWYRRLGPVVLLLALYGEGHAADDRLRPERPFVLAVRGDTVSAQITQAPLAQVLTELARQLPLVYTLPASVATEAVSCSFKKLRLVPALRQLLDGQSYALLITENAVGHGPLQVTELRIFSQEQDKTPALTARREQPTPAPEPALSSRKTSRQAPVKLKAETAEALARWQDILLNDPNPLMRAVALEELSAYPDVPQALHAMAFALEDEDVQIRKQALELLDGESDAVAMEVVADVLYHDESPELRRMAFAVLIDAAVPMPTEALQQALQDPDRELRQMARRFLDQAS